MPTIDGRKAIGGVRNISPIAPLTAKANRAAIFPRRLIARRSRQAVKCGFIAGCSTIRRSSAGLLRAKQYAARIINGTVGSSGRITPTAPSASANMPIKKNTARTLLAELEKLIGAVSRWGACNRGPGASAYRQPTHQLFAHRGKNPFRSDNCELP